MRQFWIGFGVVVVLALLVRLPRFGSVPAGLNRDEAALGYNAYSMLQTGKDEWGKLLPISMTSFGDQKLPGYVYTLVPFVGLFDLTVKTVRLPSFLAGFAVILAMGMIAFHTAGLLGYKKRAKEGFAALTMILIAISPWGNHFSRVAYEAHLAMAFFLWGFVAYLRATHSTTPRPEKYVLYAAILWLTAIFTYHSYQLLVPMLALSYGYIDRKVLFRTPGRKKVVLATIVIGAIGVIFMAFGGILNGNIKKSGGINPFQRTTLERAAFVYREAVPKPLKFAQSLFSNTVIEGMVKFSENIVSTVSGSFFFVNGTGHGDHNPGRIPNLHLFLAPFIFLGILVLFAERKQHGIPRLLIYLLAALAVPAFTIEPQHTVRISPVFPLLELLGALGIVFVFNEIRSPLTKKIFAVGMCVIAVWSTARMLLRYLVIVPQSVESHEGYHVLAKAIIKYRALAPDAEIVTQSPTSSPYIWYLFESKYDPEQFWKDVTYYPEDEEHFIHVKRVGNVTFEQIWWDDIFKRSEQHPIVLLLKPTEIVEEKKTDGRLQYKESLTDSYGRTVYEVWSIRY